MTLDEIIELARKQLDPVAYETDGGDVFAQWILDTLAESLPCGMIPPDVVPPPGDGTDGVVVIHMDTPGVYVAGEARAYAAALLRAADEAKP